MPNKDPIIEALRGKRRWADRDPEANKAYRREIYLRNPDASRRRTVQWQQENPEQAFITRRMIDTKARAKKAGLLHPDMDYEMEKTLVRQCYWMIRNNAAPYSIDHIIPARFGGWHHHDNLQVLPENLNYSKGHNPIWKQEGFKSWIDVPEFLWPPDLKETYSILKRHYNGI